MGHWSDPAGQCLYSQNRNIWLLQNTCHKESVCLGREGGICPLERLSHPTYSACLIKIKNKPQKKSHCYIFFADTSQCSSQPKHAWVRLSLFAMHPYLCMVPDVVNFCFEWENIMKKNYCLLKMSQGKACVCIALFQHLWFMWWKSEACCEERGLRMETNMKTKVQQRTLPFELLGEMFP